VVKERREGDMAPTWQASGKWLTISCRQRAIQFIIPLYDRLLGYPL
jgi:hypothetical protein